MEVREIRKDELFKLIELYEHLHTDEKDLSNVSLKIAWEKIFETQFIKYFVIEMEGKFVSSCNISILPNLTRGAKSIALIENVVTHADFRKRGLGRKMILHAITCAKKEQCYKIMLLSNRKRKESHDFYRSLGFSSEEKMGFVYKIES